MVEEHIAITSGPAKGWLAQGIVLSVMIWLTAPPMTFGAEQSEPSFMHGLGQVVGGVLLELPKTVVQATLDGPPVVGTAVGLLAGASRALQTTVGGLVEIVSGFDPWGTKRKR